MIAEFDYSNGPLGPANWGDLKPEWITCKTGTMQSPMEITAGNTVTDGSLDSPLRGRFPILPTLLATITNKGETVEVRCLQFNRENRLCTRLDSETENMMDCMSYISDFRVDVYMVVGTDSNLHVFDSFCGCPDCASGWLFDSGDRWCRVQGRTDALPLPERTQASGLHVRSLK